MSQMRIFLSHASQHKAFADELVRALREAGADVWYDEYNVREEPPQHIILKELYSRPVFVVLLSRATLASQRVLEECNTAHALDRERPGWVMLPVVVEPLDPADLHKTPYLASVKRVEEDILHPLPIMEAAHQTLWLLGLSAIGLASTPSGPQSGESATDLLLRGKGLKLQMQYDAALPLLERVSQLEPDNFSAWFNLGFIYGELGRYQEQLAADEWALTIKPNDATTWTGKAFALNSLGRYREGLEAAERALQVLPHFAPAWVNSASALVGLGRHHEALIAVDRALAIEETAGRWGRKASILRALGRKAEAEEAERRFRELGGKIRGGMWGRWLSKIRGQRHSIPGGGRGSRRHCGIARRWRQRRVGWRT